MKTSDCYYLGYVTKIFGFKGDLTIYLDVDDPLIYKKMESVFVLIGAKLIPFFIDKFSLRPNSREAVIHFQGVDNEENARQLVGKELYLPVEHLPALEGNAFYYHEIEGFEAIDEQKGCIGTIDHVLDLPANPLFQIRQGQKEILIPVRDELIVNVDRINRRIILNTPDGLIDLYLES